jgi:ATP-dependent helicase/nuclease subunit A
MVEETNKLKRFHSRELEVDQKEAMTYYLAPGGRVCVDAGAGTGKTTVLIETLSSALLEETKNKPKDFNPLEKMLVVTFGLEASRQLKTKLKERLRDHQDACGILPESIWRFIESESHIQTIDAFMHSLLRRIVTEIGLNPSFEIQISLDQDQMVNDLFFKIRKDYPIEMKWQKLTEVYPTLNYLDRPPEDLPTMIWNAHQKMREFCLEPSMVKAGLIDSVKSIIHCGKGSPFTLTDLEEITRELSDNRFHLICPTNQKDNLIAHTNETYTYNLELAEDFGDILLAFDKEYDRFTKETGFLSHVDIAYLVWHYTMKQGNDIWKESLRKKFDHILIDEFQDTNFVQYQVINSMIRDGSPTERNHIMFIGDIKQSI